MKTKEITFTVRGNPKCCKFSYDTEKDISNYNYWFNRYKSFGYQPREGFIQIDRV